MNSNSDSEGDGSGGSGDADIIVTGFDRHQPSQLPARQQQQQRQHSLPLPSTTMNAGSCKTCNWCKAYTLLVPTKPYCLPCQGKMFRECSRCHFSFPDSKYFTGENRRCVACHKKYLKEKERRKQKQTTTDQQQQQQQQQSKKRPRHRQHDDDDDAATDASDDGGAITVKRKGKTVIIHMN